VTGPAAAATIELGRAQEAAGQTDAAYRTYLQTGHVDDAARLLLAHGRTAEAADVLLSAVAKLPRPFDAVAVDRVRRATALLAQAGKAARCLQVLAWFGDESLMNTTAERLAEAGAFVEAGTTLARHGDATRALHWLLRVPRSDERYGPAAVEVVRALVRGAALTMAVDRFLAEFIRRGPADDDSADAFYALAALYARRALPENAMEVLQRLVDKRPGFKDADAQRTRLEHVVLGSTDALARVLDEDAAFAAASSRRAVTELVVAPATNWSGFESTNPAAPVGVDEPPTSTNTSESTKTPANKTRSQARKDAASSPPANAVAAGDVVSSAGRDGDSNSEQVTTLSFAPGSTVAKRYRIIDVVGRGGMSIVYKAEDLELRETLALKLFTQPTNEEAIERFKQEIKLARQLLHDNIIRVYDLGHALGARFLTMELLIGEDLHAKMTRGISLRDGCTMLAQACDGLDVAHTVGVVHRDIKPENLFVTNTNVVKVMDFGIAKQLRNQGLTLAGMVVGTPEYMAPEQAHGHMQVTPAADLYSIGIILYALATGQLPFRHPEFVPLLLMHVQQAPVPPRQINSGCPVEVETFILQLLSKNAADRPQSAAAVAEHLRSFQRRGIV
jgi:tetratricopeptide (TPR) repeat protein